MIKNQDVAKQISDLMVELSQRINDSIILVQEKCSEEEFVTYRRAAAQVLGGIYLDIMTPVYLLHPSLKPEGLP
jgi:hypothetical protein